MRGINRIVNNTLFLAGNNVGTLLIGFVLTPYMVSRLGFEQYGLWAVAGSLVGYFGLLDFGLGASFVRYIAEYVSLGVPDRIREVTTFGFVFYVVLGAALTVPVYLLAPVLIHVLRLSASLTHTATDIFVLAFVALFLSYAVNVFGALLMGRQRMRAVSLGSLGSQIVFGASLVAFLQAGLGLYGVVLATFIRILTNGGILFAVNRIAFGPVFISAFRLEWSTVRKLLSFGGWTQISNLSNLINMETDRIIIGAFVNVSSVTFYQIANKLALLTRYLPLVSLGAMLPALTSLNAMNEQEKLTKAHIQGSRYLALASLSIGGFVVAASGPILRLWLGGHPFPYVKTITALLVLAYVVNNLTGVGTTIVKAIGAPRYESYYALLGAVLNLLATLALAPLYGLYGVVVGTMIGTIVSSSYFLWLFHRLRGLALWRDFCSWLWRLAGATLLATGFVWWLASVSASRWESSAALAFAYVTGLGVVYVLAETAFLIAAGFFEPMDIIFFREVMPRRLGLLLESRPVR